VPGLVPQDALVGVPAGAVGLTVVVGRLLLPKPGTGLVVLDFSSKGASEVEASALAARFDTNVVG